MGKVSYILDTDPWYDPDDLFAITYLVNSGIVPDLVVTGDEIEGKRAKLTKWFFEQIGQPDVKVVAGPQLPGKTRLFCQNLLGDYDVGGNVLEEIKKVVESSDKTVYMGIQGFSNIAAFSQAYPDLCEKIRLYQMGGALELVREKAEHNVRIDIPAARQVVDSGIETYLVMLDTTLNPVFEISDSHELYRFCKEHSNAGMRAIAQNIDEFRDVVGVWTFMHDPLTISAALGRDFVDFYRTGVAMDEKGTMSLSETGSMLYLSRPGSRDVEFMEEFTRVVMK